MRLGFGPQDWDLGLKAGIWASRLRYEPGGWGEGGYEEGEGEGGGGGENSPYIDLLFVTETVHSYHTPTYYTMIEIKS